MSCSLCCSSAKRCLSASFLLTALGLNLKPGLAVDEDAGVAAPDVDVEAAAEADAGVAAGVADDPEAGVSAAGRRPPRGANRPRLGGWDMIWVTLIRFGCVSRSDTAKMCF